MHTILFGKHLTIELRNGPGIDIEFVDSRPVWAHNAFTDELIAMPFMGVIILLPLVTISYGNIYTMEEEE